MDKKVSFSYKEALKFALTNVIDNTKTFFLLSLLFFGSLFLLAGTLVFVFKSLGISLVTAHTIMLKGGRPFTFNWVNTPIRLAWMFSSSLLTVYTYYIFCKLGLARYKGKPISFGKAFQHSTGEFFRFFGARLLLGLKAGIGFLLLLIPGFYIFSKYYFAGFPIIDGLTDSIRKDTELSKAITRGNQWRTLLVIYLSGSGGLIGMIMIPISIIFPPLFIVALLVLPIMSLVEVHVYKQLEKAHRAESPQPTTV